MKISRHNDELETAAGMWLARRDRGLTSDERQEFEAWLTADPRHRVKLDELEGPFHALDRASGMVPPNAYVDEDFLLRGRPKGRLLRFPVVVGALATAAAIAFGIFLLHEFPAPRQSSKTAATIAHDEPERLSLPDGSVVELKPGAHVEVAFTNPERRVRLTVGEAHFTVAKNPARPFVVDAGGVAVRAVGTAFTVDREMTKVEVVVTEGRVRVDDSVKGRSLLAVAAVPAESTDPEILAAGHRVVIPMSAGMPVAAPVASVSPAELESASSWRTSWLEFNEKPLADLVQEFNRYNSRQLKIADSVTGTVPVTGTFRPDGEEAFIRLLESGFGITATPDADGNVILSKAP